MKIKEKYPHLEIGILSLASICEDNIAKRIDSEYFQNEYLNTIETIKKQNHIQLKDTNILIIHPTEIKREYVDQNEENSVWFFRTQNLRPLFIDTELNRVHISQEDASKLKKNSILYGDILITRTGANCGDCALYDHEEQAIASSHVLIVRNSFFIQSFLAVFLNTSFGKIQINRGIYGGLQPEIAPYYLKNIYIPTLSASFQQEIDKIVKDSEDILKQSKVLYKEAQDILYKELGLDPDNPLREFEEEGLSISVQTLQESYVQTGRLDAEYYQKKYTKNSEIIKRGEYAKLSELVWIKKSIEPGSKSYKTSGIPFCRVSNLGVYDMGGYDVFLDREEFLDTLEALCPCKDTILLSKDGSVGIAYCMKNDEEIITSSGILHLLIKDKNMVLPEYLCLVLNSIVVKLQAQRDCGGSIIEHWRIEEIENTLIPILDKNQQEVINQKITQSFDLRAKAKNLLKDAIAQVEKKISAQA